LSCPIADDPEKLRSLPCDKKSSIEGTSNRIKGQYLHRDDNRVLNAEKHTGSLLRLLA